MKSLLIILAFIIITSILCDIIIVLVSASSSSSSSNSYATTLSGQDVIDGQNVPVKRFIGKTMETIANRETSSLSSSSSTLAQVNPFLVFDWYNLSSTSTTTLTNKNNKNDSNSDFFFFPAHLHDGFLEIRYIFQDDDDDDEDTNNNNNYSPARIEHQDSCNSANTNGGSSSSSSTGQLGSAPSSVLEAGGFHILNAVGGIAHEEKLFLSSSSSSSSSGRLRGFQLWFDVSQHYKEFWSDNKNSKIIKKSPELFQFGRTFHHGIPRQEIPSVVVHRDEEAEAEADEEENNDNDDAQQQDQLLRIKKNSRPPHQSTLSLKCLGYFKRHQQRFDEKKGQQKLYSPFDRYCGSSTPINNNAPTNDDDDDDNKSKKDSKKNKNKKKRKSKTTTYSSKIDFGQFFDFFLMIELGTRVVGGSTSSSYEGISAAASPATAEIKKTIFRYPLRPEFQFLKKQGVAERKITCLSFFAPSSQNKTTEDRTDTAVVINGSPMKPGELQVEVLNEKDFQKPPLSNDDTFEEPYVEIEIPNSFNSKLFHVCASSSSSSSSETFQADGLVYHSRKELDEALTKMKEGRFETNC